MYKCIHIETWFINIHANADHKCISWAWMTMQHTLDFVREATILNTFRFWISNLFLLASDPCGCGVVLRNDLTCGKSIRTTTCLIIRPTMTTSWLYMITMMIVYDHWHQGHATFNTIAIRLCHLMHQGGPLVLTALSGSPWHMQHTSHTVNIAY